MRRAVRVTSPLKADATVFGWMECSEPGSLRDYPRGSFTRTVDDRDDHELLSRTGLFRRMEAQGFPANEGRDFGRERARRGLKQFVCESAKAGRAFCNAHLRSKDVKRSTASMHSGEDWHCPMLAGRYNFVIRRMSQRSFGGTILREWWSWRCF